MYLFSSSSMKELSHYPCMAELFGASPASLGDIHSSVRRLINSPELQKFAAETLRADSECPWKKRVLASTCDENGMLDIRLFRHDRFSVYLRSLQGRSFGTESPRRTVSSLVSPPPQDLIVGFCKGLSQLEFYEFERPENFEVFSKERRLLAKSVQTFRPGDVIFLRAGLDAVRFLSAEASIFLYVTAGESHSIAWNMDLGDPGRSFASSADAEATRIRFALEIISRFKFKEARSAVAQLARAHPAYFIRWDAIRCMNRIDPQEGREWLRMSANDPHPQVRSASQRSLEQFRKLRESSCG